MATKGKRLIFCDEMAPLAQEGLATTAGILPGSLVEHVATGFKGSNSASTVKQVQTLVADYHALAAGDVDTAWTQNENMVARVLPMDKRANVRAAIATYAVGTALTRDGAGRVKPAVLDGTDHIIAYADEILNVTTAGTLIRVRGA